MDESLRRREEETETIHRQNEKGVVNHQVEGI